MCGIVGIVNLKGREPLRNDIIQNMTDQIIHRGPDGEGFFIDERVAFGHRRLKIIDLSDAGQQPMSDITGRYHIIFNGEIYNYQEIKEDLLLKGYEFRSVTDTEVLLNSFMEYGIDCIRRCVGMFSFVIYDSISKKVYAVRDRLGVKPLFYAVHNDKVIICSEVKSILKYPGFTTHYNISAISSYLSYRYAVGESSLFENIKSLQPGHLIEIGEDRYQIKQYYELPINKESEDKGEEFYIEQIRDILYSSVKLRMVSDVPFGAYLSGGLDSSIVVALMSKVAKDPIKTFTIGFEEEGFNEFEYARQVAEKYKTEHHEFHLSSQDYFDAMKKLIRYKDAPLGVPNEPALHIMSAELRKYITVVLSGEGADELFGGYGRIFRSPYDYERLVALRKGESLDGNIDLMKHNLSLKYKNIEFKNELEHFLYNYQYIKWADKTNFLSEEAILALNGDETTNHYFYQQFNKLDGMDHTSKLMWLFEKIHLVGLLQRVDMTTMATSVEARVPFVDHRLVEFAMSIPVKYKLRWNSLMDKAKAANYNSDQISERFDTPKYILKKAFEKSLPKDVVWRKKMGFPVPVHKWFGEKFNGFAKEILLDHKAKSRGLYNGDYLEKGLNNASLFEDHKFGLKIWMMVNLELWMREYF